MRLLCLNHKAQYNQFAFQFHQGKEDGQNWTRGISTHLTAVYTKFLDLRH